jgi:hypothetical protein
VPDSEISSEVLCRENRFITVTGDPFINSNRNQADIVPGRENVFYEQEKGGAVFSPGKRRSNAIAISNKPLQDNGLPDAAGQIRTEMMSAEVAIRIPEPDNCRFCAKRTVGPASPILAGTHFSRHAQSG